MNICRYCNTLMHGEFETLKDKSYFFFTLVQNVTVFMKDKQKIIRKKKLSLNLDGLMPKLKNLRMLKITNLRIRDFKCSFFYGRRWYRVYWKRNEQAIKDAKCDLDFDNIDVVDVIYVTETRGLEVVFKYKNLYEDAMMYLKS